MNSECSTNSNCDNTTTPADPNPVSMLAVPGSGVAGIEMASTPATNQQGGGKSSEEEQGESSDEEEEGASSEEEDVAADDVSDDIDVTETFDQAEFGDGDESRQICSNMSCIIITWNTCAEDRVKVFREEICDMFGVEPHVFFYIAHYSKYIRDDHRARE
ncbi:MAG: hypothetical protein ACKPKO_54720, partial [Candidatus Fonsibacter sp.]